MKNIRRLLCVLLAAIMIAGVLPMQAAATTVVAEGQCGNDLWWTLTGDGVLTISGTGDMWNWEYNWEEGTASPWYNYRENVYSVIIHEGVTSIGNRAFFEHSKLKNVSIPEGVTYIGDSAFRSCLSIEGITIPEGVDGINVWAFSYCESLKEITIPGSVGGIWHYAFMSCSNLKKVTIQEGVSNIGGLAFASCESLTEITIPESVNIIGDYAFYGCTSLEEITFLEGLWGVGLSIGDHAFESCESLVEFTIPRDAQYIGADVFHACRNLKKINVAEGNSYFFSDEYGVLFEESTMPPSVERTLRFCPDNFTGHYTIPDNVIHIGDAAFASCTNLEGITIPESVTSIGASAFSGCRGLTEITIPEGVTSIGAIAFSGCRGLTEITIPEGVTSIGDSAFDCCRGLKEITIPNSVTSIGASAFNCCDGLTEITIPNSVTDIGDSAFYACINLEKVILSENLSCIGSSVFSSCHKLSSITIPKRVTSIGDLAFNCCDSLPNITIPESVTNIGDEAFALCTSFTHITLPKGITTIGKGTFYYCSNLKEVSIPDSVTYIGESAFKTCKSLKEITIPGGVTYLGNDAFANCSQLRKITFMGNAPEMFDSTPGVMAPFILGTFGGVVAYAYYPQAYESWTQEVLSSGYGGYITWISTHDFHKEEIIPGVPATCTTTGLTEGKKCSFCGEVTLQQRVIPMLGHAEVTVAGRAPSCSETGLTEGKKCSVCGVVMLGQQVIPKLAHTEVTVAGRAPSCSETGLTEGKKCSVCGKVTLGQQVIPKLAHTEVTVAGRAPSCSETGLTEGKKCSVCGKITLAQQTIKANGHSEITVSGKAPTCAETGLTAGKKCSICGTIFVSQQTIPAPGCAFTNYTAYQSANCIADGTKIADCIHGCGNTDVITVSGSRDPDAHSFGDWITEGNRSQRSCRLCGHTETKVNTDVGNVEIQAPEQPGMDFEADPVKPSDNAYILVEEAMDAVSGEVKEIVKTFDITLKNADGVHVQPDGSVLVKLPLDWDKNTGYKVYRVNDDGTLTDMGAYRQGSHVIFETDHFSLYVIAEETEHTHEYQKTVSAPTCTKDGFTTYTCYCGESYTADPVPLIGHSNEVLPGIAATCTRAGLVDGTKCSVCGETTMERQIIGAKGHSHEAIVTPPTCTKAGYTTYTCACGDSYQSNFTEPSHNEKILPAKDATCYDDGLTEGKQCSVCGEILVAQEEIPAPGRHTFNSDQDPFCALCGEVRSVPMFRMYDPNSGEHFYTGSVEEREILVKAGWNYEGVGFNFPVVGDPVHRLYEPATGEHLYTMDEAEMERLLASGWNYEGVAFNSAPSTEIAQYRLHNPNGTRGAYHFTGDIGERDWLISLGWKYQGIGWYSCLR